MSGAIFLDVCGYLNLTRSGLSSILYLSLSAREELELSLRYLQDISCFYCRRRRISASKTISLMEISSENIFSLEIPRKIDMKSSVTSRNGKRVLSSWFLAPSEKSSRCWCIRGFLRVFMIASMYAALAITVETIKSFSHLPPFRQRGHKICTRKLKLLFIRFKQTTSQVKNNSSLYREEKSLKTKIERLYTKKINPSAQRLRNQRKFLRIFFCVEAKCWCAKKNLFGGQNCWKWMLAK